jgi:hypothetical protein
MLRPPSLHWRQAKLLNRDRKWDTMKERETRMDKYEEWMNEIASCPFGETERDGQQDVISNSANKILSEIRK